MCYCLPSRIILSDGESESVLSCVCRVAAVTSQFLSLLEMTRDMHEEILRDNYIKNLNTISTYTMF